MWTFVKGAVLLGAALTATACTIVDIRGARKVILVRPGILQIQPEPGAELVTYRATGIGLIPGLRGATLGVAHEETAIVTDKDTCRVIVFALPRDVGARQRLLDSLTDNNLCIVGEKPK